MKAMILAAGKGERLKPITNVTPKCLVYVNGKTLLERHFNMLVRSGVKEVVINLGWLGDKILEFAGDGCKFGLEIHYSNDQDEILSIRPDLEKLKKIDYPSIVVTSLGDNSDFVSRNFAPKLGIPEDPVTGSSHCELIPYWSKKINKKEMIAFQISERGGKIYCTNKDNRVLIGGKAVTFLRGEIDLIY